MRERRCFVQFIHPGGEHRPDDGDFKFWNRNAHRRKFLKSGGRYLDRGQPKEGEVVFWGEWEPESRVIDSYVNRVPDGPHFLYEPFFVERGDGAWRQNTDPFVFGEQFHYTGCLQHTRRGPTQLRFLSLGSLVLFGSCRDKSRFVVDTVFVVSEFIDHSVRDWEQMLDGRVSTTYRKVTLEPWYRGSPPEGQSHRLYFGATQEDPVGDMFSFFPCRPHEESGRGFARPEVHIPSFITRHLTQSKKLARDLSVFQNFRWRDVQLQGFLLAPARERGFLGQLKASPGQSGKSRFSERSIVWLRM